MKSTTELKQEVAAFINNKLRKQEILLLGSGSTVNEVIKSSQDNIRFVSSSKATSFQLKQYNRLEIDLDQVPQNLDRICIDGADLVLNGGKYIIKGHGGALVREKITWQAADKIIVAIDETKLADRITKTIPIAIIPFGCHSTMRQLKQINGIESFKIHYRDGLPYNTDDGLLILHITVDKTIDLDRIHHELSSIPGVVDTGIFFRSDFNEVQIICAKQDEIVEL